MSNRRHANIGLEMTLARRAQEDNMRAVYEGNQRDLATANRNRFEVDSTKRFQAKELRRRSERNREEMRIQLEARQARLANLLAQDEQEIKYLIDHSVETPTQRKMRLQRDLDKIREEREIERQKEAKEREEQAWIENCDPLRTKISRAIACQVAKDRKSQVIEKEERKAIEEKEETEYAEETKKATREYYQRIAEEREEKLLKEQRNKKTLTTQIDARKQREKRLKDEEYAESLIYRSTAESLKREAEEADREKRNRQAATRRDLDRVNQDQQLRKRQNAQREREEDEKVLQAAKEAQRQEEEDRLVQAIVAKKRQEREREFMNMQRARIKQSEDEAEYFIEKAQRDANDREDAMRQRMEDKRRALLMDAVEDRKRAIREHEQKRGMRKYEIAREREELEEDIRMKKQLDDEAFEARRRAIKNQYDMLDRQVTLKRENTARRKREEDDSVRKMIRGWKDEDQRIQDALNNPEIVTARYRGHR